DATAVGLQDQGLPTRASDPAGVAQLPRRLPARAQGRRPRLPGHPRGERPPEPKHARAPRWAPPGDDDRDPRPAGTRWLDRPRTRPERSPGGPRPSGPRPLRPASTPLLRVQSVDEQAALRLLRLGARADCGLLAPHRRRRTQGNRGPGPGLRPPQTDAVS